MKTIKIALLGIGNVGGGTAEILYNHKDKFKSITGKELEISHVLVRDLKKNRNSSFQDKMIFTDSMEEILNSSVDIVVEALGGIEPASTYMIESMKAGKHVVSANKAAIAANFPLLSKVAEENNVEFLYEASVAGGIPILTAINDPLQSNNITEVMGILNGTTNYILSKMTDENLDYDVVLKSAQDMGFAEADPTADVEGSDVANKLSILIALSFGSYISPDLISTKGISHITMKEILEAKEQNKKIKLIGYAKKSSETEAVEAYVKPMTFTSEHPLYSVNNEFNAVYVKGDSVGELMFYGKGAGPLPTGSAVVGDIIKIAQKI